MRENCTYGSMRGRGYSFPLLLYYTDAMHKARNVVAHLTASSISSVASNMRASMVPWHEIRIRLHHFLRSRTNPCSCAYAKSAVQSANPGGFQSGANDL